MRRILFFLSVLVSHSEVFAFTVEPSAAVTTLNKYQVENINADYELSGAFFRLDTLFDFGDPLFMDSTRYFWGAGLAYGSFRGDLEDPTMASATLPVTGKFNTYVPSLILGLEMSGLVFKLSASPFVQIDEDEGVTQGDKKYGYGGGLEIGYRLFEYMSLNVGYNYYTFSKGKNSSTGLSGSLANPVSLQFLTVGASFPFNFNSIGEGSYRGSSSRSSRRTTR